MTRPDILLLVLPPLVVFVWYYLRPFRHGWILSSRPVLVAVCSGVQPGDEGALTEGNQGSGETRGRGGGDGLTPSAGLAGESFIRPDAPAALPSLPSVSACLGGANDPWPALPDGWDPVDVELTLMDIEYAEAFTGGPS